MSIRLFVVLLMFLFTSNAYAEIDSEKSAEANFLVLTDIHFDPFIMCYKNNQIPCPLIKKLQMANQTAWPAILAASDKAPEYKQDTNYTLLVSSLQAAKQAAQAKQAQFVLVLGDMLGHDYRRLYKKYAQDKSRANYQIFVKKTLAFLADEVAKTFPTTDVYFLVGNNDTYHGDYYSNPHGQFFQDTANTWSPLIKNKLNRQIMQREFPLGGYYAVNILGHDNIRLIMLNTVLFSNKGRGDHVEAAANQELDWLHAQLKMAKEKNQRVLIGEHIPEGIDVYSSLNVNLASVVEFWHANYAKRFEKELEAYPSVVAGIFAGHLHADWFQVQRLHFNEIPVLGTPSISPLFGNNPGFKIYSYSPTTRQINDFVTYYYPLNQSSAWKAGYHFSQIYKPNCYSCSVVAGMQALQPQGPLADFYKKFYAVKTSSQPITTKWDPYYWCAIHEVKADTYRKCIR